MLFIVQDFYHNYICYRYNWFTRLTFHLQYTLAIELIYVAHITHFAENDFNLLFTFIIYFDVQLFNKCLRVYILHMQNKTRNISYPR